MDLAAAVAAIAPSLRDPAAVLAEAGRAPARAQAAIARALEVGAPAIARAADADEAALGFVRAFERVRDPAPFEAARTELFARAALLLGLGGMPAEQLLAQPELILALEAPLDASLPAVADLDELRALRRDRTLPIAAAELAGALPFEACARGLSDLACALLDRALALARVEVASRRTGTDAPLAVLALGKLGGRELNYSSDVDLVIVRGDDAPPEPAEEIARVFVRALGLGTGAGRLYRVDMRLRPQGSVGPLAPRAKAAGDLLMKSGQTWERQAWVKARVVAGDLALGERFLASLEPFVWTRPLDAKGIEEILALRHRIEERAGDAARDVKLGPGGIRDVEFCVQFLQLLHGGKLPEIRTTTTLDALDRLARARVLTDDESSGLARSYRFLRRVEHALQLSRDRELRHVPEDTTARLRLARALGITDLAAFDRELHDERARARATLDRILRRPFAAAPPRPRSSTRLMAEPAEDPALARARSVRDLVLQSAKNAAILAAWGFRDVAAAARALEALAVEKSPYLAPSGRARTLLAGLAPRLLDAIARAPDPDQALRNFERATATLGAKATFYELLTEATEALDLFVAVAAASDFLVETLARRPGVFDEVVDRLLTGDRPAPDEIAKEMERALATGGDAAEALRDVRAVHLLLVGIRDVSGKANLQNTGRDLARLAEAGLAAILGRAREIVALRRGGPAAAPNGAPLGLGALALGKLGGNELSYSSDLDLLLIHDAPGSDELLEEVAREAIKLGEGPPSDEGPLWPIDLRLRPAGQHGRLVHSLDAAVRYYQGEGPGEHARDFERLALQKLRPVGGEPDVAARAAARLVATIHDRAYGR
jgi:glutamate-ammonia-ligase adenylyltransferase